LLDNSASIAISKPANFNPESYKNDIQKFIKDFGDDYEVKALSFGNSLKPYTSLQYKDKVTDIAEAFKYINTNFSGRNIGAVVLATDGIYNRGSNPQYEAQNTKSPVYTIALGDTVPKKDLLIANVNYNNIVYSGNDFQIEVELEAYQSKGSNSRVSISDNRGKVYDKAITITSNEYRQTIPVTLSAKQKGIQKFTATIAPLAGELSKENNFFTFFIEVIDGRQKVLILSNSPHPDIAAIKQSIETNKNYEVKTALVSNFNKEDIEKANLLILHQLPSANFPINSLKPLIDKKSCWFILGEQTNLGAFSNVQNLLAIASPGNSQETFARFNTSFYDFVISEASRNKIQTSPPLLAPFGNYILKAPASTLLNQQIGKVGTDKPLLVFSKEGEQKTAVLCGEGIWRWRLDDFKENNSHQAIDELISKTVQLLANKNDKRKFRVYPAKNAFDESEHIIFNGELYNNAFELVNTPDVSLNIKNDQGKRYSYLLNRTGNAYILDAGILPSGEYSYTANTQLGETKHQTEGRFIITHQLAEFRQTTANHQILYNISRQSNGELIYPNEISGLAEKIKKNELVKMISYENRRYEDLINMKPLFFITLVLLSIEWFSRKRNGEI